MYLVFEHMQSDLKKFIDSFKADNNIPIKLIKEILLKILLGLEYLNFEGILHRDLKPQNVLINYNQENGDIEVKLGDFGLSRTFSNMTQRLSRNISKNKFIINIFL